jgi:flagellar motor switch protein FliM
MSVDAPLLSGEETQALLDAMRASDRKPAPSVDSLDLTAPDRALRDALGFADRSADDYSRELAKPLLRTLGCSSTVEAEPSEISPYDVFRTSIGAGSALVLVTSNNGSHAFLTVGSNLVSLVLERRLGAPPKGSGDVMWLDASSPAAAEAMSAVDCRIVRPFLESLVETFAKTWCAPGVKLTVAEVYERPEQIASHPRAEPLLRMTWRVAPFAASGDRVVVAMTGAFLQETMLQATAAPVTPSAADRAKLLVRIQNAAVEVSAVLGRAPSTVRELLALETGDVLRLGRVAGQPVEVCIGKKPVFLGQPIVHHGNMAVELVSRERNDEHG